MKKTITLVLCAILALTALVGCGKTAAPAVKDVDLQAFFEEITENYETAMTVEVEGEMLDALYPGLSDIEMTQCVAQMPMITAAVYEYVFVQCKNMDDVAKVEAILQNRVDEQANGGAWYPESMEGWSKSVVLTKDNYVLMIADAENAQAIAADFAAKF